MEENKEEQVKNTEEKAIEIKQGTAIASQEEQTDNSKTDIKDVANRKNPLHGTGGNARRRRSRIDVF